MQKRAKILQNLSKINDTYKIKFDNITVEMKYSKNNKSFNECILNILKQKLKNG